MSSKLPLSDLLPQVITIAEQAGDAIMNIYNSDDFDVTTKADDSPLTAADTAANNIIIDGLRKLDPVLPIISEETLAHAAGRLTASAVWIVDPVDGTKEFIKRNGQFTVNIALVVDGKPVLGVVLAPALELLYYGAQDVGAFKRNKSGEPTPLTRRLPNVDPIAAISASHPNEETADWLSKHNISQTLSAGSSLKICYVADGTVDVYPRLGPQNEWDIAAADAVLRAAGGAIRDLKTNVPVAYNKPETATPYYVATLAFDPATDK